MKLRRNSHYRYQSNMRFCQSEYSPLSDRLCGFLLFSLICPENSETLPCIFGREKCNRSLLAEVLFPVRFSADQAAVALFTPVDGAFRQKGTA